MKLFYMPWVNIVNFKGKSNRTEFFIFAITNFCFSVMLMGISSMLMLYFSDSNLLASFLLLLAPLAQAPMVALVVRRLRNSNTPIENVLWLLIPLIGIAILAILLLKKTFVDYEVTLTDGRLVMASTIIEKKRADNLETTFKLVLLASVLVILSSSGGTSKAQKHGPQQLNKHKRVKSKDVLGGHLLTRDGRLNRKNTIFKTRGDYMRNGKSVAGGGIGYK